MGFVLLVTWFVNGQPPSSYQATFDSMEKCSFAAGAIELEAKNLKEKIIRESIERARLIEISQEKGIAIAVWPQVVTTCAPK